MKWIDVEDVAFSVGVALLLVGAWLMDWRLALVVLGLLLIVFGAARSLVRYDRSEDV